MESLFDTDLVSKELPVEYIARNFNVESLRKLGSVQKRQEWFDALWDAGDKYDFNNLSLNIDLSKQVLMMKVKSGRASPLTPFERYKFIFSTKLNGEKTIFNAGMTTSGASNTLRNKYGLGSNLQWNRYNISLVFEEVKGSDVDKLINFIEKYYIVYNTDVEFSLLPKKISVDIIKNIMK